MGSWWQPVSTWDRVLNAPLGPTHPHTHILRPWHFPSRSNKYCIVKLKDIWKFYLQLITCTVITTWELSEFQNVHTSPSMNFPKRSNVNLLKTVFRYFSLKDEEIKEYTKCMWDEHNVYPCLFSGTSSGTDLQKILGHRGAAESLQTSSCLR